MKTKQQIEYERRVMKLQAYNKMKVKYDLLKGRKTVEVDEYYDKKLLRAWRRYEKNYDLRTKNLIIKEENKSKEESKKKPLKQKKEKTWQWWFDKAKATKQKKRVLEEKAKGNCKCVTCNGGGKMQGGHMIKAEWKPTALLDINIRPQCYKCNIGREGMQGEYFVWFESKFSKEQLDGLRLLSKTGERPSIEWMKEEIARDQNIIKSLQSKTS